jgi:hypothetical protein
VGVRAPQEGKGKFSENRFPPDVTQEGKGGKVGDPTIQRLYFSAVVFYVVYYTPFPGITLAAVIETLSRAPLLFYRVANFLPSLASIQVRGCTAVGQLTAQWGGGGGGNSAARRGSLRQPSLARCPALTTRR